MCYVRLCAKSFFHSSYTFFSLVIALAPLFSIFYSLPSIEIAVVPFRSASHFFLYLSLAYIHTHTHSHIFLFIPFIYVVFIKPLWRLPPHFLYLRECEFIEYINNCFLLALRYLIIIYYQWLLKLRISLAAAAVCV